MLESYVDEDGDGFPFTVQLFSALKRIGIEEANDKILDAGRAGRRCRRVRG